MRIESDNGMKILHWKGLYKNGRSFFFLSIHECFPLCLESVLFSSDQQLRLPHLFEYGELKHEYDVGIGITLLCTHRWERWLMRAVGAIYQ